MNSKMHYPKPHRKLSGLPIWWRDSFWEDKQIIGNIHQCLTGVSSKYLFSKFFRQLKAVLWNDILKNFGNMSHPKSFFGNTFSKQNRKCNSLLLMPNQFFFQNWIFPSNDLQLQGKSFSLLQCIFRNLMTLYSFIK